MLNVQTKRGCPFNCIYCTYPLIEGKLVRTLEIKEVVETLESLTSRGYDYIFFTDSVFNIDREYNEELMHRILEKNLKFRWGAYFSFHDIDEKMLSLMQKGGLTHIEFGTDSLSDSVLIRYGKSFSVNNVIESSKIAANLGIYYAHFLILGGPGETMETLTEGFENSKKIEKSIFFPFVGMRIYPGTELYRESLSQNIIKEDESMMSPYYYISPEIDIEKAKKMAEATGKTWVFPDASHEKAIKTMRLRGRKGPLWEYLIR